MSKQFESHELEQKRIEFIEFQRSEHFSVDDVEYETVEKFIETCGQTMVPALLSVVAAAAVREGCFRNHLSAIRFVATAMEEELERLAKAEGTSDE